MERNEGFGPPALTELVRLYHPDFQMEIRGMLDELDLSLVNLEAEPDKRLHIQALYERLHAIGGLFGLMQDRLGKRISSVSEELLETIRKYRPAADPQGINLLVQSSRFLRRIASDASVSEDSRFTGEAGQHLLSMGQLRADLMLEIRQPLEHETRIGEILIREGAMEAADVEAVLSRQMQAPGKAKFGEMLLREKRVEASDVIRAIRMQKLRTASSAAPFVRVPLSRMEELLALVDEVRLRCLGIQGEAQLRFGNKDRFSTETAAMAEQLDDFRKGLAALRMVPLHALFEKLTQTLGSLLEEARRQVRFTTVGEAIEVDKDLADRLFSPVADLLALFLDATAKLEGDASLGILELVAYRETDGLHLDITGDGVAVVEEIRKQEGFEHVTAQFSGLGGRLLLDDLRGTGIRARMIFAEQEGHA